MLFQKAVQDKADVKRCSMNEADQNLRKEIADDKQPELVAKVEKEAVRRKWCKIS